MITYLKTAASIEFFSSSLSLDEEKNLDKSCNNKFLLACDKEGVMKRLSALLFCIVIFSGFAFSQEQYGNIRGVVVDEQGEPLPGATITLECTMFGRRSVPASEGGIFRFLNLSPGTYSLKCELPGFKSHIQEVIDIRVGINFDFRVALEPAALEEEVTVVAHSPIVDTKKTGAVTVVTWMPCRIFPQPGIPGSSSSRCRVFSSASRMSEELNRECNTGLRPEDRGVMTRHGTWTAFP
jgi:hypothetical protein